MSSAMRSRENHIPFYKTTGAKFYRAIDGDEYYVFIFAADIEGRPMRFFDIRELAKAVGLTMYTDAFIAQKEEQRMGTVQSILGSASQQLDLVAWLIENGWMWRP